MLDEFCGNGQFYAKSQNCGKNDRKLWNDWKFWLQCHKIVTLISQNCVDIIKRLCEYFWFHDCTIFRFSIILSCFCLKIVSSNVQVLIYIVIFKVLSLFILKQLLVGKNRLFNDWIMQVMAPHSLGRTTLDH